MWHCAVELHTQGVIGARLLHAQVGRQTPLTVRFSTVVHERGSPETLRDVRGFSVKMYVSRCVRDVCIKTCQDACQWVSGAQAPFALCVPRGWILNFYLL